MTQFNANLNVSTTMFRAHQEPPFDSELSDRAANILKKSRGLMEDNKGNITRENSMHVFLALLFLVL